MACFQNLADHFLDIFLVILRNPAQGKTWTIWSLSNVVNHLPQGWGIKERWNFPRSENKLLPISLLEVASVSVPNF